MTILKYYSYIVIANVILSWLVAFNIINTGNRFVYSVLDISYKLTASLHSNKPRDEKDLYPLYKKQGGSDSIEDFNLKWASGEIEVENVRELREFKSKIESLK